MSTSTGGAGGLGALGGLEGADEGHGGEADAADGAGATGGDAARCVCRCRLDCHSWGSSRRDHSDSGSTRDSSGARCSVSASGSAAAARGAAPAAGTVQCAPRLRRHCAPACRGPHRQPHRSERHGHVQRSSRNLPSRATSIDLAVGVIIGARLRQDRRLDRRRPDHADRRPRSSAGSTSPTTSWCWASARRHRADDAARR